MGRARQAWALALAATAAGALLGGTYHGFEDSLAPLAAMILWKSTTLMIGAASLALVCGAVDATMIGSARVRSLGIATGLYVLYAAWMLFHDEYVWVIAAYGTGLVVVLVLLGFAGASLHRARRLFVWSVVISIVAAGVQQLELGLSRFINHNDVYHLVQMAALYFLYRAGRSLTVEPQTTTPAKLVTTERRAS